MQPEQQRALGYLQRTGTESLWGDIRRRCEATFAEIESVIEGLDAETAARRPAAGGWCAHEVVDHLVESHQPGAEHLACLLRGERPAEQPIPASLQSARPFDCPWRDLVGRLAGLHRRILSLIDGAPEEPPAGVTGPVAMVIKAQGPDGAAEVLRWTEELGAKAQAAALRVHTLEHLAQLRRILQSVT